MDKKLMFIMIFAICFIMFSSPVIASENDIALNQVTENALFDLNIWNWIFPTNIDIVDLHIVKENFKHTHSDGKVTKSKNYYLEFYVKENSADNSLEINIKSYDKKGNCVDNTNGILYGTGENSFDLHPSSDIVKSDLLIYNGGSLVFNKTTKVIEKTSNEQVDEPVVEKKTEDTSSSSSVTYWGSSKSNKFHYPSCEWGQKISSRNKVVFHSRSDAINSGYVPCQVCSP